MAATTRLSNRPLAAMAVLALTASACAGSDSDPIADRELEEFQSTTTLPTTEAPPETAASTTSTTTELPTTTAAPTTIAVVPVTDAPTTTSAEPADPRDAEIAAALQEFSDSWVRCAEARPNCDPAVLAQSAAGPQLEIGVDIVTAGNLNGETITNLESYRTQLQSVNYVNDSLAEARACTEDGLVVTDRSGQLKDDEFISTITIWTFEVIDGTWKVTTGRELREASGRENSLCDF